MPLTDSMEKPPTVERTGRPIHGHYRLHQESLDS